MILNKLVDLPQISFRCGNTDDCTKVQGVELNALKRKISKGSFISIFSQHRHVHFIICAKDFNHLALVCFASKSFFPKSSMIRYHGSHEINLWAGQRLH